MLNSKKHTYFALLMLVSLATGCATDGRQAGAHPQIDRVSAEALEKMMPQPHPVLSLDEIVTLSKQGLSHEQIIQKIKETDSSYALTPSQSVDLSNRGVDKKVLDYIHTSRELALRNKLAEEINKREQDKRAELAKLKQQMINRQRFDDPFCRYQRFGFSPYGFGAYGSRFGPRFGMGAGYFSPWGCW
ncbi:MAG: hypothetical protein Q7U33_08470 [Methylotenera sp.]|jgi:hypothetical protein|uniref:hypothetical protein n=1 Tax=Methylotenera sp. TaxID=2051956 RepID=UPI002718D1E5|nr:hypothetical protein [Methylotenera sp.]MDO9151395.1 hypothetical protein [Methylotenera sp.]